jgi:hypothetical protein
MKYLGQVEIERTEDIYEDTETGNVYKIVTEKTYDIGIESAPIEFNSRSYDTANSEIYIEIYQDSMMHPNSLYIEKDPGQVELLLKKILGSEK